MTYFFEHVESEIMVKLQKVGATMTVFDCEIMKKSKGTCCNSLQRPRKGRFFRTLFFSLWGSFGSCDLFVLKHLNVPKHHLSLSSWEPTTAKIFCQSLCIWQLSAGWPTECRSFKPLEENSGFTLTIQALYWRAMSLNIENPGQNNQKMWFNVNYHLNQEYWFIQGLVTALVLLLE